MKIKAYNFLDTLIGLMSRLGSWAHETAEIYLNNGGVNGGAITNTAES